MNALAKTNIDEQWQWWLEALAGNRGELTRGDPKSGFYRDKQRACAIWRDEGGKVLCAVSSGFCPRNADEIDDSFGLWSMHPIPHEVYTTFVDTGRWPDDIDPPREDRGIGDNSAALAPHEQVAAEVRDLLERFQSWLKSIGGKIDSEEQDAKAAKYAKAIADLGKKAETTRETLKRPHLEAGNAIQATWKPVVAEAEQARKTILAPTTAYRIARDDEQRRQREEDAARQRAQQEKATKVGEQPAPLSMPAPKPTGLRTVKRVVIRDLRALAAQIASFREPEPEFLDVCSKIARRMLLAKAEVHGAELIDEKVPS